MFPQVEGGWSFWDSRKNDWVNEPELRVVLVSGRRQDSISEALGKMSVTHLSHKESFRPTTAPAPKIGGGSKGPTGKLSMDSFVTLRVIGRGSFGEVRVASKKATGEVYAIKHSAAEATIFFQDDEARQTEIGLDGKLCQGEKGRS